MLDFSSSLYLGMRHPHAVLAPWGWLSLGKPAALEEPPGSRELAYGFAELTGCQNGVFAPSTLHLFWDIFGMLGEKVIFQDDGAYPVMRWGVARAECRGSKVFGFRHGDPDHLQKVMRRQMQPKRKPVVVADGFCPGCGQPVPLGEYLAVVRNYDGCLLIDDTQTLGVLGKSPSRRDPYGEGGGGSLQWHGLQGPDILAASSLAKGFGVPVAFLGSDPEAMKQFIRKSETRMYCSPPSAAVLHAAAHALNRNRLRGDELRGDLLDRIRRFRGKLLTIGLQTLSPFFPVQTIAGLSGAMAIKAHRDLHARGIKTVLHAPHGNRGNRLSFIITASHCYEDIDLAVEMLASLLRRYVHQKPFMAALRKFQNRQSSIDII
ncbi:MAG: aminotransferase class I/II-fold pyridoxal phosphate-dependent enzyme [Thermodesulfobacteriota bacterium]